MPESSIQMTNTVDSQEEVAKSNEESKEFVTTEEENTTTQREQVRIIEQYKVFELDWMDVESRMKLICKEMLEPVSSLAKSAKTGLEREA